MIILFPHAPHGHDDAELYDLEDRAYKAIARRQALAKSLPRESAPAHYRAEMKKLMSLPTGEEKAMAFGQLSQEVTEYCRGVEELSNPKTKVDNTAIERFVPALGLLGAVGSLVLSATVPFMILGMPLFLAGSVVVGALWEGHREEKEEKRWKTKLEQFKSDPLIQEMAAVAAEIKSQSLEAEKKAQEVSSSQKNKSPARKKKSALRKSAKAAFGTKKPDKKAPPVSAEKKPNDRFRL